MALREQRTHWDLQEEVAFWASSVFPKATNKSIIAHLKKEVKELSEADNPDDLAEEVADCYLILLHLAHKNNFDLFLGGRNKLEICQQRKWKKAGADGVVEHDRRIPDKTKFVKAPR